MAFQALGDLMNRKVLTRPGVGASIQASMIVEKIEEVFRNQFPVLAAHVRIAWYKNGELAVAPQSGSAAAEMRLRNGQVLHAIRRALPEVSIVRMRSVQARTPVDPV